MIADLIRLMWTFEMRRLHQLNNTDLIISHTNSNTIPMSIIFEDHCAELVKFKYRDLAAQVGEMAKKLLEGTNQQKLIIVRDECQQLAISNDPALSINYHFRPLLTLFPNLYGEYLGDLKLPIAQVYLGTGLQSDIQAIIDSSLEKNEQKAERNIIIGLPFVTTTDEAFNFLTLHSKNYKVFNQISEKEFKQQLEPFLPVRRRFLANVVCSFWEAPNGSNPSLKEICEAKMDGFINTLHGK
ncbi:MAG: hypothetical protein LAT81_15550 [Oceanicaulis sp.]|nr:hypothetical protein [Oceanicaulis sp.]